MRKCFLVQIRRLESVILYRLMSSRTKSGRSYPGASFSLKWRYKNFRVFKINVSLALLFTVKKRMTVQKRPNKMPAYSGNPKNKSRMLEWRVMASFVDEPTDFFSLPGSNFKWLDQFRTVACSGACDSDIVRIFSGSQKLNFWFNRNDKGSFG